MEQIEEFAAHGVYIEILADAFKIEGCRICWRSYVHWKEDKWEDADLGCYPEYSKAVDVAVEFAKTIKNPLEMKPKKPNWRRVEKIDRTAWEALSWKGRVVVLLVIFPALIGFSVLAGVLFVKLAILIGL
jgi:hypothetical protein